MRAPGVAATIAVIAIGASKIYAHGIPINVFLDETENRLTIHSEFDAGSLNLIANTLITGDLPGIGVLSPGNGVADGSAIELEILSGLLFWDGVSIASNDATLLVDAPTIDGFGHSNQREVATYEVTESSTEQTGMTWGVYDAAPPGWDAHGSFSLLPNSASPGVYGVAMRIAATEVFPTKPLILPLVYDPFEQFTDDDVLFGIATIDAFWKESQLIPGDANGDGAVDLADFSVLKSHFGESLLGPEFGDFDNDGEVGLNDFTVLKGNFGATAAVPEPSTLAFSVLSICCFFIRTLTKKISH